MRVIDMTGQRFGKLTVTGRASSISTCHDARWLVSCDGCDRTEVVRGTLLRRKKTECFCSKWGFRATHGLSGHPLYNTWRHMMRRCYDPNERSFKDYGARGIKVHASWHDFASFIAAVSPRPSVNHSIDRLNNDGNYEPGNIRWAVIGEQALNRRDNVRVEHDGRNLTVAEWSRELSIKDGIIRRRLRRGFTISQIIEEQRHV